jgi:plastocyanin
LFKSWQVFVFTLVPLALIFTGVILSSFHGADSAPEVFPTAAPRPTSSGPPPPAPAGTTQLSIAAENLKFDKASLTAPAGQPVQLMFDNKDAGQMHNVAVYADRSASTPIFKGELDTGPNAVTYSFNAPSSPGSYFFHCDVHPDMAGTFTVN